MSPPTERTGPAAGAGPNTITGASVPQPGDSPRRYREKACAACGASFAPPSGRARFCAGCRDPKWVTARNTESKQRQRAEDSFEDQTRPPRDLAVHGPARRQDRIGWVREALTMARRLHRAHRIGLSQEVVKWAT